MSQSKKLIAKVENYRKGEFPFADLRRYLELYGWTVTRVRGSHHLFVRPGGYDSLPIPVHRGKVKASYVKEARHLVQSSQAKAREV